VLSGLRQCLAYLVIIVTVSIKASNHNMIHGDQSVHVHGLIV
jgi:hypothetical protein